MRSGSENFPFQALAGAYEYELLGQIRNVIKIFLKNIVKII